MSELFELFELFDAVDALVASRSALPSAEERKRLRVAHGLTLDEIAAALKVRRATVSGWESTKKPTEPRGPEREAYARLLAQLAELYPPAAAVPATFTGAPAPAEAETLSTGPAPEAMTATENTQTPAPPQGGMADQRPGPKGPVGADSQARAPSSVSAAALGR